MIIKPFDVVVIKPHALGDVVEEKYHLKRDEHGNSIYKKYDEINIREYVRSYTAGCSLRDLLERCSLMPTVEKLRMVNQTDSGVSADLSNMPKDATEAFILLKNISAEFPDVADKFSRGEPFNDIIKSIVDSDKPITKESEVNNNGEE